MATLTGSQVIGEVYDLPEHHPLCNVEITYDIECYDDDYSFVEITYIDDDNYPSDYDKKDIMEKIFEVDQEYALRPAHDIEDLQQQWADELVAWHMMDI